MTYRRHALPQTLAVLLLAVISIIPCDGVTQTSPPPGTMTFALTGDAIVSQRLSPFTEPEYLTLIDLIRSADLAFTNLEVLFHTYQEGYPAAHSGGTWMAAEPHLAKELVWAGFDMVSLANNHTMDYSAGGLRSTVRALDAVGLTYAGAGENLALARAPAYAETAGGRVALVSIASTFSDEDRAGPQRRDLRGRPGLSPLRYNTTYVVSRRSLDMLRQVREELGYRAPSGNDAMRFLSETFEVGDPPGRRTTVHEGDLAEVVAAVQEARRQADWVIVAYHGHESGVSREVPADFQVTVAHAVVDAGADIWVGHGPHVLRGAEIYGGKPIFYSLSNFVFQNETVRFLPGEFYDQHALPAGANTADAFDARNERSAGGGFQGDPIFWESVVAMPAFINGELQEISLVPITLGHGKPRPQRGRPLLADRQMGQRIIEKLTELSQPFGTLVRYDSTRNVGVMARRDR